MNELIKINNNGGNLTVSSLEVAEHFGKQHKHVLDTIGNLIRDTGSAENSATPLFIENTYIHPQNKQVYKCYEITRDGFSLLVMGFTGRKALEWKLKYIEAFNRMEQTIREQHKQIDMLEAQAKADRATAMRLNAENRRLKLLFDNPQWKDMQLSGVGIETLGIKSLEKVTGVDMGNALPQVEQTWSATEIAAELGVSAMAIGKKANALNLKTEEYGIWVLDKSRYSNKEVKSFRYNQRGREVLENAFRA